MNTTDELTLLRAENERLKAELAEQKAKWAGSFNACLPLHAKVDQLRTVAGELAAALNRALFELGRVNRFAVTEEMGAALAAWQAIQPKPVAEGTS